MCHLSPYVCHSSMELELPWDPVYESCKAMMVARDKIVATCPFGMVEGSLQSPREVFVLDCSIKLLG